MTVKQGAFYKALGTVWAGVYRQREVGKGVPQEGAQGELGEVTQTTSQVLGKDMAQQVVSECLKRMKNT